MQHQLVPTDEAARLLDVLEVLFFFFVNVTLGKL